MAIAIKETTSKEKKKNKYNVRQFLAIARGVYDGLTATKSGLAGRGWRFLFDVGYRARSGFCRRFTPAKSVPASLHASHIKVCY